MFILNKSLAVWPSTMKAKRQTQLRINDVRTVCKELAVKARLGSIGSFLVRFELVKFSPNGSSFESFLTFFSCFFRYDMLLEVRSCVCYLLCSTSRCVESQSGKKLHSDGTINGSQNS